MKHGLPVGPAIFTFLVVAFFVTLAVTTPPTSMANGRLLSVTWYIAAQDLKAGQCASFLGGTNGVTAVVVHCSNQTNFVGRPVYPCVGVITADAAKGHPVTIAGPGEVVTVPNLTGITGISSAGEFVGDVDGSGNVEPMGFQLSGVNGAVSYCGIGIFNEPTVNSRTAIQLLVEPGYVGQSN